MQNDSSKIIKPIDKPQHISLLIPTRGRPKSLEKTLDSFERTVSNADSIDVWIYVDNDDDITKEYIRSKSYLRYPFKINWVFGKRIHSIGQMINILRQKCTTNPGIYLPFADDYILTTDDWDIAIRDTFSRYPDGIVLGHIPDGYLNYSDKLTIAALSAEWTNITGKIFTDIFPFWSDDTWLDNVSKFVQRKARIDAQVEPTCGKGKTRQLKNLPFWQSFHTKLIYKQLDEANLLLKAIYPQDCPEYQHSIKKAERLSKEIIKQRKESSKDSLLAMEENLSSFSENLEPHLILSHLTLETRAVSYLFDKADSLIQEGDFNNALEMLDNIMLADQEYKYIDYLRNACLKHLGLERETSGAVANESNLRPEHKDSQEIYSDSNAGWKLTSSDPIKESLQQTNDPEAEIIHLCQKAVDTLQNNEPSEALKILNEAQKKALAENIAIAGLQTVRAACLTKLGRLDEAASAVKAELSLQPDSKDAQKISELIKTTQKKQMIDLEKPNNYTNRPSSQHITWEQIKQMPLIKLYAGDLPLREGYDGLIGLSPTKNDQNHLQHDITQLFPLENNSVDSFQAEDVFEHIPYEKLVPVVNEIYRILKPDGLLRLSVPDYGCDVLQNRSVKGETGQIVYDPGGGGTPDNPGHVWFPRIDTVMQILTKTKFHKSGKIELLHYYNKDGTFVAKPIDYSKGHVRRTPDFDERVKNPYRPMSLVIDLIKGRAIASQNRRCRTWGSEKQNQYTQSQLTENSPALSANQQVSHSTPSCSVLSFSDAEPGKQDKIYILPVERQFQPTSMMARYPEHNDFYGVEQDFLLFLQNHKELITHNWQEARWHYLPVFWTHWLVSHDYGKRDLDKLQQEVNRCILDDSRTFTICQYADGPLVDVGLTSVFLSSRNTERGIDIPCLCTPHKKPSRLPAKKYIASFVGRLSTGEVRRQMAKNLEGYSDVLIIDNGNGTDYFVQTMLESYIALSPRGYGGGSFRFYEAMQLGIVPFLIGDIDTRAFKDFINWDEVSFYAPDASDIAERLRRMNKQQLLQMGAKAAKVWAEELSYQNWCRYVIKELQSHSDPITGFKVNKLKNIETIGTDYGGWTIPKDFLNRESICYCVGAGEDISFDVGIANQYGCNVHIFDPTPRAITHFNQLQGRTIKGKKTPVNNNTTDLYDLTPNTLRKLHFSPTGIWDEETSIKFYAPKNPQHVSHSILNLQKTDSFFEAKVNRLSNIMRKLKHNRIDLLKLDIKGAEYKVIDSIIDDNLDIKVLCIEFDETFNKLDEGYLTRIKNHLLKLKDFGFVIIDTDGHCNYTLIKKTVMQALEQGAHKEEAILV